MPRRRARGMRQRDDVEGATVPAHRKNAADDGIQFGHHHELPDSQFSHGNDEMRSQNIELIVHPCGAIADLIGRRTTIAAGGRFSGETATDCRKINASAHLGFGHSAEFVKPAEQGAAGCPRKRPCQHRLLYARRLTDEQDLAQDGAARNGRGQHSRATTTLQQGSDMLIELALSARILRHSPAVIAEEKTKSDSQRC